MCEIEINVLGYMFVIAVLSVALIGLGYSYVASCDYSKEMAEKLSNLQGDLEINALILSGSFGKIHGESASKCMMMVVCELGVIAAELDG